MGGVLATRKLLGGVQQSYVGDCSQSHCNSLLAELVDEAS